jgi:hypothetical protein
MTVKLLMDVDALLTCLNVIKSPTLTLALCAWFVSLTNVLLLPATVTVRFVSLPLMFSVTLAVAAFSDVLITLKRRFVKVPVRPHAS